MSQSNSVYAWRVGYQYVFPYQSSKSLKHFLSPRKVTPHEAFSYFKNLKVNDFLHKIRSGMTYGKEGRRRPQNMLIGSRISKMNSERSVDDIVNELRRKNIAIVSRVTNSWRLCKCGLFGRVAVKKPFNTKKMQSPPWICSWVCTLDFWRVAFSDERTFDGKWWEAVYKKTRDNVRYQRPAVLFGGRNIMVWGVKVMVRINEHTTRIMYRDILRNN